MFIVSIEFPYVANKCLCFQTSTFVVDADTEVKVMEIIVQELPEKDPEIQKSLCEEKGYKDDEYFSIRLCKIPKEVLVYIYEPNSGFNSPYDSYYL